MIIDEWLRSKIINNSTVSAYSTRVYPNYIPYSDTNKIGSNIPCFVYASIGSDKNRLLRNMKFTITSVNKSKSNVEDMNNELYSMFDNSTSYLRETSSNISIDSVEIINNGAGVYYDDNKYWTRALDISVWYH